MRGSPLNIIGGGLAGFCPWGNLLLAWGMSLLDGEYERVKRITALIVVEFVLFISMYLFDLPQGLFIIFGIAIFFTLITSMIYCTYIFWNDPQERAMMAFGMILLGWVVANFNILLNVGLIFMARRDNKPSWTRYPVIMLLLAVAISAVFGWDKSYYVILFLNMASFTFWLTSKKMGYDLTPLISAFNGGANTTTANNTTISSNVSIPINTAHQRPIFRHRQDEGQRENVQQVNTVSEKGWSVDDTVTLQVELLTIEDIIFPIMLKNEYEKCVKDLIIYVRKLNRYSNAEIETILGRGGLSSYLDTFFPRIKMDFIRGVYIKSLYIVLRDYAEKRDSRVVSHLEKLTLKVS